MCVCIELVIVCSFIFDNFFFISFFLSFFRFFSIFVGGLIRLHQLSYCRNCFSVLWLINTHWPYVQIEYNKMYRYSNRKSTYMCINYIHTNTLDSIYLHWQIYLLLPLSLSSHIIFASVLRLIPHWKLMGAPSHIHTHNRTLTCSYWRGAFNELHAYIHTK